MYESAKDLLKYYNKIYEIKNAIQSSSIDDDIRNVEDRLLNLQSTISNLHIEDSTQLEDFSKFINGYLNEEKTEEEVKLNIYVIGDADLGKSTVTKFLNESIDNINFVDMPAYSEEDMDKYRYSDGIIYLINPKTMYFKKDPELKSLFDDKPNIAILSKIDLFDDPEYMLADAKKYFEEMASIVLPFNGVTYEGQNELLIMVENRFIKDEASLRVKSVFNATSQKILELKKALRSNVMKFRQAENSRIAEKASFKKSHQKILENLILKIDMMLGSYEVDVKQQVNYRSKDVFEAENMRLFIEDEVFKISELKVDIKRLIESIENELAKLLVEGEEKILLQIYLDEMQFINVVELNLMLDRLNESGLFASFQKKRRLQNFQNDLMNMMNHHVTDLKKVITDALKLSMNHSYQMSFDKIDHQFEETFCLVSEVGKLIRIIDDTIKVLELSNLQVDIKDIILGHVK